MPVNPSYIKQVAAKGATYLNQSKWLNQFLIYCADTTIIHSIKALPFVKSTAAVGLKAPSTREKIDEKIQPIKPTLFAVAAGMVTH